MNKITETISICVAQVGVLDLTVLAWPNYLTNYRLFCFDMRLYRVSHKTLGCQFFLSFSCGLNFYVVYSCFCGEWFFLWSWYIFCFPFTLGSHNLILFNMIVYYLLQIARVSLTPESSYIAKPAASWLDDFLVWISPEAFGCCRKFTNESYCPPNDQVSQCLISLPLF